MSQILTPAIDVVSTTRDRVGESPLWHTPEQALYWVDIEGRFIRRFDWATRSTRSSSSPTCSTSPRRGIRPSFCMTSPATVSKASSERSVPKNSLKLLIGVAPRTRY